MLETEQVTLTSLRNVLTILCYTPISGSKVPFT